MTAKNLALATTTATSRTTKRSFGDRFADEFNVKDYGAKGDFVTDDSDAIDAAMDAWAGNGNLVFPVGGYKVTRSISLSRGNSDTSGRILGAGKVGTSVFGNLPNGFVFTQFDGAHGPESIEHLSIVNSSTWIGSGALLINNSQALLLSCKFSGMIGVLCPNNITDMIIQNCTGGANIDATTGNNATLGIAGACPHIIGWRTTGQYQTGFQLWGGNSTALIGNGLENCEIAILAGKRTGWASSCTVSGATLTVGGTVNAPDDFGVGYQVYGKGLTPKTWGTLPDDASALTITGLGTGTGGAGTYTLSANMGTISTPIPVWTRRDAIMSGVTINSLQTEACYVSIYLNDVADCQIAGFGGGGTALEFPLVDGSSTGLCAHSGIYIRRAAATTISGCTASMHTSAGSIFLHPTEVSTHLTFVSCTGSKHTDTTGTGTISNGSGGAGTVLTYTYSAGDAVGIGRSVTGSGVSATRVIGNHFTDPTLTGQGLSGTYRVDTSQNVASTAITIATGADWVMPTGSDAKTSIEFVNCGTPNLPVGATSGLNTLNRTFTSLPGQAGANQFAILIEGQEYNIVDGAKSGGGAAAIGDATQGGGSGHYKVWYNGTSWIRIG